MLSYNSIPVLFLTLLPITISGHPCETDVVNTPIGVIKKVVPKGTDDNYEERIRLALSGRHPVTVSCTYGDR